MQGSQAMTLSAFLDRKMTMSGVEFLERTNVSKAALLAALLAAGVAAGVVSMACRSDWSTNTSVKYTDAKDNSRDP